MADDQILINAPVPTLYIGENKPLWIEAPEPTIVFTSYSVAHGSFHITAPAPTVFFLLGMAGLSLVAPSPHIVIHGQDNWYELNIDAPHPTIAISTLGTVGILRIRAPDPDLTISGNDGSGNAFPTWNLDVPVPVIAIESSDVSTGEFALSTPLPVISIYTGGIVEDLDSDLSVTDGVRDRKCVVLNTDLWEVTEYTWAFDQLVKFGNLILGIDATGIYVIGGDTEDGEPIDSIIETGFDNFDIIASKRISNLHVEWKSTEDALIQVVMEGDDDQTYEYDLLATNGKPGASRVRVGYPIPREYINLKILNVEGADFDIYGIDMILSLSIRKVQGIG